MGRRLRDGIGVLTLCTLLVACGGVDEAYVDLQNSISGTLTHKEHMPVASVACTPKVQDVSYSDGIVDLTCEVRFNDGSSYRTPATIEARSFQVAGYDFTWSDPPPTDITTAALPRPSVSIPPTGAGSLFLARNLRPAVRALATRFGTGELVLSLALYPGELEAVIGSNGQAQLVTVGPSGKVEVVTTSSFDGSRSGVEFSQLDPAVPQRLAGLIAARGGVPRSGLDRFVLTSLRGGLAGWNIYPTSGSTRYQALLDGGSLKKISPSGIRSLH